MYFPVLIYNLCVCVWSVSSNFYLYAIGFFVLLLHCKRFSHVLNTLELCITNIFLSAYGFLSHYDSIFKEQKLTLMKSNLLIFIFKMYGFYVLFKKSQLTPNQIFSFKSFKDVAFTFRSMAHFELFYLFIFLHRVRLGSRITLSFFLSFFLAQNMLP